MNHDQRRRLPPEPAISLRTRDPIKEPIRRSALRAALAAAMSMVVSAVLIVMMARRKVGVKLY